MDITNEKLSLYKRIINYIGVILKTIINTSVSSLIKLFLTIFFFFTLACGGIITYKVITDDRATTEIINHINKKEESAQLDIRRKVSRTINNELKKMLYTERADRVCIFEFHNGKENVSGLPFKYADLTYELIDDTDVTLKYLSNKYQDIPLSHFTINDYMYDKSYCFLPIDSMFGIDNRLYIEMKENGGNEVDAILLKNNGKNLGTLAFFYDNKVNNNSRNAMLLRLQEYSKMLSKLLDLKEQEKEYVENNIKHEVNE